jgi:hypothetical protein
MVPLVAVGRIHLSTSTEWTSGRLRPLLIPPNGTRSALQESDTYRESREQLQAYPPSASSLYPGSYV